VTKIVFFEKKQGDVRDKTIIVLKVLRPVFFLKVLLCFPFNIAKGDVRNEGRKMVVKQ